MREVTPIDKLREDLLKAIEENAEVVRKTLEEMSKGIRLIADATTEAVRSLEERIEALERANNLGE